MYEVHAFVAEGEATEAQAPEYDAGERYALIVFCRQPRDSRHDYTRVEEIARRFGWNDLHVSHGGVLQPELLNGDLSDLQDSFIEALHKGGSVVSLGEWLSRALYVR